ncbi:MAG: DUF4062 domain-containing protein [Oscillospiraceae bacterium]|nr:DUF4062 domain-containing protein [Oscillospiraceae bacterium]
MDKRYQVFVSSTYQDLQEERREVMQALLELDCIPAGMELFPASSEDQWSLIKRVIDDCDYYLLIVGGRYGSTNDSGVSYTEMEYDYAASTGKPMICFLPKHPERIESGKTEQTEAGKKALAAFKEKVQHKMVKFYENPADLGSAVCRSVVKLIKTFPAEGWVKASNAIDDNTLRQLANLQSENEALRKELDDNRIKAPEGSSDLAQGSDYYNFKCWFGSDWEDYESEIYEEYFDNSIFLTWDELFAVIAPRLIGECNEGDIQHLIDECASARIRDTLKLHQDIRLPQTTGCHLQETEYGKIILQFKALGLIKLSSSKHGGAHRVYWTLTPYGDYVMTHQCAIKKIKRNLQ